MRTSAGRWPGSPRWYAASLGVDYALAGMDLLVHLIGWSVQVPARRAAGRNEAVIAAWREESWPVLKGPRRTWAPGSSSRTSLARA
jgi:Winged helix-turn helix